MLTIQEAIEARHSVRQYEDKPIAEETRAMLDAFVDEVNKESGLHIFIRYDDPKGFDSRLAHYGRFRGVSNYIVLSGVKGENFEYLCGYYGEKIVLYAQQLGLNTCWVALTFNKKMVKEIIPEGETLCMVISLGYGQTQGVQSKNKAYEKVAPRCENAPSWFKEGVRSALLAPTAVNQQKFSFSVADETACAHAKKGPNAIVDLGIVCYHFEVSSGHTVKVI